jgi:hypothetical protein
LQGVCGAFRLCGCLLSGRYETFEGFAGLIDGFRGQITDFGGDFIWDLGHGLHLSLATFRETADRNRQKLLTTGPPHIDEQLLADNGAR